MRTARTLIRQAAQADLSLCWEHSHFVGFVMSRLNLCDTIYMREAMVRALDCGVNTGLSLAQANDWKTSHCPGT